MTKTHQLAFAALLLVTTHAHAVPVVFEKQTINNAWGKQNKGCFVDFARHVYTYDVIGEEPMKAVARIPEEEFAKAREAIEGLQKEKLILKRKGADVGATTWTAYRDGKGIVLKEAGDLVGELKSAKAKELVQHIEKWCTSPEEKMKEKSGAAPATAPSTGAMPSPSPTSRP